MVIFYSNNTQQIVVIVLVRTNLYSPSSKQSIRVSVIPVRVVIKVPKHVIFFTSTVSL